MDTIQWTNIGIDQILSEIDQSKVLGRPLFVFIAGGSCSGKTTLANELKKQLPKASILNMDDYFRDFDDPDLPKEDGRISYEKKESYYLDTLINDLKTLNLWHSVFTPVYDIKRNKRTGEKKLVFESDIVIVEGLFAIDLGKDYRFNQLTIFVDAPYRTRLIRRITRIKQLFPQATEELIEHHFRCYVERWYKELIYPQARIAHLIIKNE